LLPRILKSSQLCILDIPLSSPLGLFHERYLAETSNPAHRSTLNRIQRLLNIYMRSQNCRSLCIARAIPVTMKVGPKVAVLMTPFVLEGVNVVTKTRGEVKHLRRVSSDRIGLFAVLSGPLIERTVISC
jgi:hypothetical protein